MEHHEHHWQPFTALAPWTDAPLFWCPGCKIVMDAGGVEEWGRLYRENAALREIAESVAAINENGGWDRAQPYDAQVSLLTITKARALLAEQ